jgi:hypothetical protein
MEYPRDGTHECWITDGEDEQRRGLGIVLHFRQRGSPAADRTLYERGWDLNFHTLTEYFKHFAGRPETTSVALTFPLLDRAGDWQRMHRAWAWTRRERRRPGRPHPGGRVADVVTCASPTSSRPSGSPRTTASTAS